MNKSQELKIAFFNLSMCKNESKYEGQPIRKQYFDIWIHFYAWYDNKKIILKLALLYI